MNWGRSDLQKGLVRLLFLALLSGFIAIRVHFGVIKKQQACNFANERQNGFGRGNPGLKWARIRGSHQG
jgi:hypothetical protein